MEARYNIYFAGEVIAGHATDSVREKLAKVFNADQQTLDKLFSGKPQLIKRDCDKATAVKYKTVMERAGAQPIIKAAETPAPAPAASKPMTAAEKIAALAAAPDAGASQPAPKSPPPAAVQENAEHENSGINLAPEGTAVLREEERAKPVIRDIDTSSLTVDAAPERLSEEPPAPPPAPDTSHLDIADAGATIPNLPAADIASIPNTDALDLSPADTGFNDCNPPAPEALPLDLSALDLAPPASDLLEDQYRNHDPKPAPSTDHISLKD